MSAFPGVENPTREDRLGLHLAENQLDMVFALRAQREAQMTIHELAERMNIDAREITRFEAGGSNPTLAFIRRYAKHVNTLITYTITPNGTP